MYIYACFFLSAFAATYARNLDQKLPLRHIRKDVPFANTTTTTTHNVNTTTSLSSSSSTIVTDISTSSIRISTTSSLHTTDFTSSSPTAVKNSTTSPFDTPPVTYANTTTTEPTCTGIVTYIGSVPPTVFVTVTEGYDVTVTASNVSVEATETLVTPLPACNSTVLPPLFNTLETTSNLFKTTGGNQPLATGRPHPGLPAPDPAPDFNSQTMAASASAVYSQAPYTSTVSVTKKTPITVVSPPTDSPAVIFQSPPSSATNPTSGAGSNRNPSTTSGGNAAQPHAPGDNNPTTTSKKGGPGGPGSNRPGQTAGGIGNIIASIIYSGFPPRPAVTLASSTTINGVPVVVLPSTVVIGGHSFAIPSSASTSSVQVDGVGFEIGPSRIVAPSATVTLAPEAVQQDQVMTITPRPTSTTVTAADGLTFVVGQTVAVISGTTYRIGQGASPTTVTIDGTKISLGPNGVGLPRTTVAPAAATVSGYVVYTVNGITFSVDNSEAVISGTTYRIGSNAPQMTTVIDGETISFGSGGIGLHSTTIVPTSVPASTGSGPNAAASASATGSTNSAASSTSRIPVTEMLGWYLMATCLLGHLIS